MLKCIILLFCVSYSLSQLVTSKSFQASATFTKNGRSVPVTVFYNYTAQRLAHIFTVADGSETREVFEYDKGIQHSMCSDSPSSCQSTGWSLGQWIWFSNSSQTGITDSINGKAAVRFDLTQPNGWTSSIWFDSTANAQGINPILRAEMSKVDNFQVIPFSLFALL
jgi:hypothetical protein